MKKIFLVMVTALFVTVNFAYAIKPTQEEKDAKKADRVVQKEDVMTDKKAERDAKIEEKKAEIAEKKRTKLCERVDKNVERLQKRSQDREQRTIEKLEQRRAQIIEKRTTQNKELQERRQARDVQREEFYAQMREMAGTEDQLAAVDAFEAVIEPAIIARRTAIDAATEEMRTGIDALVDERINSLQKLYTEYQDAESVAIAQAESYCGEDSTEQDIKGFEKQLRADLKAAGEAFKDNVREQRNINKAVQELAQTRRDSVKLAVDQFKTVMQEARVQLALAFGLEDIVDMDDGDEEHEDEVNDQDQETSEADVDVVTEDDANDIK
jgi:hypothetical protein